MSKCRKTSFCELRFKDVINICDGRMLGRIIDVIIDASCGRITGLIVPGRRGFGIFRRPEDLFIPWRNILRIGEDVILVEIFIKENTCNIRPKRGFPAEPFMGSSSDYSQTIEDVKDDELRPKVLKYITASTKEDEEND